MKFILCFLFSCCVCTCLEDFLKAVQKGQVKNVEKFLSDGADANMEDKERGLSALMVACIEGHYEIAQALLSNGANVNAKSSDNLTPLMLALSNKHSNKMKIAEILLSAGAEVNVHDNVDGWTSLMLASVEGDTTIIQMLIANGANVDAKTKDGRTALMVAKNAAVVDVLISIGANANVQNNYGDTPLIMASQTGDAATIELLASKGADLNVQNKYGLTAISLSAYQGDLSILELLISKMANANIPDVRGATPLMWACLQGHSDAAEMLVKKGKADLNKINIDGFSSLYMACLRRDMATAEMLVSAGANLRPRRYLRYWNETDIDIGVCREPEFRARWGFPRVYSEWDVLMMIVSSIICTIYYIVVIKSSRIFRRKHENKIKQLFYHFINY